MWILRLSFLWRFLSSHCLYRAHFVLMGRLSRHLTTVQQLFQQLYDSQLRSREFGIDVRSLILVAAHLPRSTYKQLSRRSRTNPHEKICGDLADDRACRWLNTIYWYTRYKRYIFSIARCHHASLKTFFFFFIYGSYHLMDVEVNTVNTVNTESKKRTCELDVK